MKLARLSDIQQVPLTVLDTKFRIINRIDLWCIYLSITHSQARDEAACVDAQSKQHDGGGHTESVSRVAREIETWIHRKLGGIHEIIVKSLFIQPFCLM